MIMTEDSAGEEAIVRYMKVRIITAFCLEEIGYIEYMAYNKPSNSRFRNSCDVIEKKIHVLHIKYEHLSLKIK